MEQNYFDEDSLKQTVKKLDEYLWNITKNVVCTICHEFFTEPVTTTCGHSFCLNCFRKLLYRVSNSKNSCPLCRHPIKRREANKNHILSKIAKMCFELPVAFRADVVNLNPALRGIAEELVNNSRILEILYEKNGRNVKKCKTKAVTPEVVDLNDSGSSISGIASIKMTNETNNLEDNQDLKSVSQLKSRRNVCKSDLSEVEKKIRRLGEIPFKQKVDDWLHDVGADTVSNNFYDSASGTLENAEHSRDGRCDIAEQNANEYQAKFTLNGKENASSSGSIVRIDYDKSEKAKAHGNEKINMMKVSENEVSNDVNDPYEFIGSQKSGCKLRRKAKRARKKILPIFESIQNFTRDALTKKSCLISDSVDESKICTDRGDNASGVKKMKIESATVYDAASSLEVSKECENRKEGMSTSVRGNAAEKADENLRENSNKTSLDDKEYDSDESSVIVKRSRLGNVPSIVNASAKRNKSTRIRAKKMLVISDSSSVNSIDLDESPIRNSKNVRDAPAPASKNGLSGNENDSKTGIISDSENAAFENFESGDDDDDDDNEIKSGGNSVSVNDSNYCVSPGWSRVSNLKEDFNVADQQKRQTLKSLNISGGEPNLSISRHKTPGQFSEGNVGEVDYLLNNVNNNNTVNLYIEDLSQNPDLLAGFDAPNSADEEEEFKKAVGDVEEELMEMVLETEVLHCDGHEAMREKENNVAGDVLTGDDVKNAISTLFPENRELNESSLGIIPKSVECDENDAAQDASVVDVGKTQNDKEYKDSVPPSAATTDSTALVRSTSSKTIPFALLGKIKKKRKFSTAFLQLGRLSPHLRRSRSTVVKIVFPKVSHGRKGHRSSSATVGVQTDLPCPKEYDNLTAIGNAACIGSGGGEPSSSVRPRAREKVEAQIQTSQSLLQSAAKEVQTSQMRELVHAYVQTCENNNEDRTVFAEEKDVSVIPSQIFRDFYSCNVHKRRANSQCTNQTAGSGADEKSRVLSPYSKGVNEFFRNESPAAGEVRNEEDEIGDSENVDVHFDTDVQRALNKTWVTGSQAEEVEILKCQSAAAQGATLSRVSKATAADGEKREATGDTGKSPADDRAQDEGGKATCIPEAGPSDESDSDIFIEQTPPELSCAVARDFDAVSPKRNEESDADIRDTSAANGKSVAARKEDPTAKGNADESFLLLTECQVDTQKEKGNPVPGAEFFGGRESATDGGEPPGRKPAEDGHCARDSGRKDTSEVGNDDGSQGQPEFGRKCDSGSGRGRDLWCDSSGGRNGLKLSSCKRVCVVSSCVANRENIEKFVEKFKIEHSANPTKEMTHLIVGLHKSDDDELVPFCTPKLLYALANKKWIVTEDWVEACLMFNAVVSEEWFESLDPAGGNACNAARLSTGYLLEKCEVCLLGEFKRISREEFSGLIRDCGGAVVQQPTEFSFSPDKIRMILGNGPELQGEPHVEAIMRKYRTAVMSRDVIIVSIQNYKIVNFTPFLLGSATVEELVEWGYSYDLVKNDGEGLSDNEKDCGDESESDDGRLH